MIYRIFKTAFLAVFLLNICLASEAKTARNSTQLPDFAFPKTVEKNSRANLNKAIVSGDNVNAVRQLLNLVVAENLISKENTLAELATIDSVASILPEPYSALTYLIEADIYYQIFSSNSQIYSDRIVTSGNEELNPQLWDKKIFTAKIDTLLSLALLQKNKAEILPLKSIEILITPIDGIQSFSVYDFIAYKTIAIREGLGKEQIIPFYKSADPSQLSNIQLLDQLLEIHREPSDARNTALIRKAYLCGGEGRELIWQQLCSSPPSEANISLLSFYFTKYIQQNLQSCLRNKTGEEYILFREFYDLLLSYRSSLKGTAEFKTVDQIYAAINSESVALTYPQTVESKKDFQVEVSSFNQKNLYILILDAAGIKDDYLTAKQIKSLKVVNSRYMEFSDSQPFVANDTITLSVDNPGKYILIASSSLSPLGVICERENQSFSIFKASDIDLITIDASSGSTGLNTGCFVVNSSDGKPVQNSEVTFISHKWGIDKKRESEKGLTNSDGFISTSFESGDIKAKYHNSQMSGSFYTNSHTSASVDEIRLFSSQAMYKPGDEISFMGVVYENNMTTGKILQGKNIEIALYDANFQKRDSVVTVSDSSGRIFGSLSVPPSGLLGRWSLRAQYIPENGKESKERTFNLPVEIAEYKVPQFVVTLSKESADNDSICFKGLAATYSGMPVANAAVSYTINYRPDYLYRWNRVEPQSFSSTTTTDYEGNFSISLPLSNLDPSLFRGTFLLSATVTDDLGATIESNLLPFWLRDSFSLSANVPEVINITDNQIKLDIKASDPMGLPVVKTVVYSISPVNGNSVVNGEFESPIFEFDARDLPSGKYIFKFRLKEESGDNWTVANPVLYRNSDPVPPVESIVWCPETRVVAREGEDVIVRMGSSFAGQNVLCTVVGSNEEVVYDWLPSDGKMNEYHFKMPSANERKFITFSASRNHQFTQCRVVLIPEAQTKKLNITTETFRQLIHAGDNESWKFRLTLDNDNVSGYAYALLYDQAMDAIQPLNWNSTLFTPYYKNPVNINGNYFSNNYSSYRRKSPVYVSSPHTSEFNFQTYGYPLYSAFYSRGEVKRLYSTKSSVANTASRKMEQPMVADAMAEMAVEEETLYEAGDAADLGAVMTAGGTDDTQAPQLRPVEMPVAFFKPNLSTNTDGEIEVNFTVPDFNTTWQFVMGSYTPDLHSAIYSMETKATKAVMVKMLPPRFIRTGDEIILTANLYNNSSDKIEAEATWEIFNPVTNEIIKKVTTTANDVAPSRNQVFSINFSCPDNINIIGLRAYARSGNHSDGEEILIPVLPSSQPVVESVPFYLKPGEKTFRMQVPEFPDNASVIFTYCDNPVWEVVTALPSLQNNEGAALTTLLPKFYANAVGSGLIKKYATVRRGLEMITNGEAGDSLLVSNLSKNQDLKIVELNNTPWVNNAASENLRLSQLSNLLDEDKANSTLASDWQKIIALRNSDGGWSWCPNMSSSRWLTQNVLFYLALLKSNDYLPELSDLNHVIKTAIKYCDSQIVEDYNKYGKKSGKSFLMSLTSYLYVRSFFPEIAPSSTFGNIRDKALNQIGASWKECNLYDKASVASILWRSGKQKNALTVLESIREFATFNDQGAHFDNLDSSYGSEGSLATTSHILEAFEEIRPGDDIINDIRQWLIIQKQAQEWGKGSAGVYTINALLSSGSEWTGHYPLPKICIGDSVIQCSEVEKLTGSCKIDLTSAMNSRSELTIFRESPTQAWGGFVGQYIMHMKSIKADSSPILTIDKSYLVIKDKEGGNEAEAANILKVGDKIRVTLTIECDQDMDYVVINDMRAACLEPAGQLSRYTRIDGMGCYQEIRNSATNLYFPYFPKGRHLVSYEAFVTSEGEFSSGIATAQCLYSPTLTSHSGGDILIVTGQ